MSPRVGVLGASGRMGRMVCAEVLAAPDLTLVAAVAGPGPEVGTDAGVLVGLEPCGVVVSELEPGSFEACEVVIDFSMPEALASAVPHLGRAALVSGTTGLPAATEAVVRERAAHNAVLTAANFSVGVNLLLGLVRAAAGAMPDADIEIVETHHRHKVDAPSGTALALGTAAQEGRGAELEAVHGRRGRAGPRPHGELGYHALRGGDVAGEHTVWLLADGERISLSHSASSRSVFAAGAVRAARWIVTRGPGRYTVGDVLGL